MPTSTNGPDDAPRPHQPPQAYTDVGLEQILDWLRSEYSFLTKHAEPLDGTTSLQDDLRVYGDDIGELLQDFSTRFDVDMSNYLWYFHTGEEGFLSPGAIVFPPPDLQVHKIPITLELLRSSAAAGRWNVTYPAHVISPRYDIWLNRVFALGLVLLILYSC